MIYKYLRTYSLFPADWTFHLYYPFHYYRSLYLDLSLDVNRLDYLYFLLDVDRYFNGDLHCLLDIDWNLHSLLFLNNPLHDSLNEDWLFYFNKSFNFNYPFNLHYSLHLHWYFYSPFHHHFSLNEDGHLYLLLRLLTLLDQIINCHGYPLKDELKLLGSYWTGLDLTGLCFESDP